MLLFPSVTDAPPLAQLGSPGAREATVAPVPGAPVSPVSPLAPVAPAGPCEPAGPAAPAGPAGPCWFQEIAVVPFGQLVPASCSTNTCVPLMAALVQQPRMTPDPS